jgi:DnaD/phage-associated family protein
MKKFNGFPARMQFTAIPNLFFSSLLPEISDIAELKTTLYLFWLLYQKRGYPRFVTYAELAANKSLMSSLQGGERTPDELLRSTLEMAVKRGTILHLVLESGGTPEDVYFLNTEPDRRVVSRIQNGELALAGLKAGGRAYPETGPEPPDIFTLYEENIGLLTPMIAEELKEAERLYPEEWIKEAVREAVSLNKRSWRYITRILENWSAEGKSDGAYRRDSKKTDTDKYIKGQYGHMVRH